jgi:hypothetical protein
MLRQDVRRGIGPFVQTVPATAMDLTYPVPEGQFSAVLSVRLGVLCSAAVVGRNIGVRLQRGRTADDDGCGYLSQNTVNMVATGNFEMQWGVAIEAQSQGFQLNCSNPLPKVVFDRPFQVKFPTSLDIGDQIEFVEVVWITGTLSEVLSAL